MIIERTPKLERIAKMIESQCPSDVSIESLEGRVKTGARLLRIETWIEHTKLHKKLSMAEAIKAAERYLLNIR